MGGGGGGLGIGLGGGWVAVDGEPMLLLKSFRENVTKKLL